MSGTNYAGLSPDYIMAPRDYYRLHVTLSFFRALLPGDTIQQAVSDALGAMQDAGVATPVGAFQEAGEGESAVAVFDVVINADGPGVGQTIGWLVAQFENSKLEVTQIEGVLQEDTGDAAGSTSRASDAATDSAHTGPLNNIKNAASGVLPKLQNIGIIFAIVLVVALGALVWYYLPKRSSRAE